MKVLRTLPLLLLLAACGSRSSSGPEETAQKFFEAATRGDTSSVEPLLTAAAREELNRPDSSLSFGASGMTSFQLGEPKVTGDTAEVPAVVKSEEQDQSMRLCLRRENDEWRVYGMVIEMGAGAGFPVSFEGGDGPMQGVAEQLADGLAEAFQQSIDDWQKNYEAEQIARQVASYGLLESVAREDHDRAWKVDVSADGRDARTILTEIAESVGLTLDEGPFGDALSKTVAIEAHGASRAQVVEEVASEVGLVPVYEMKEEPKLTFRSAPRRLPVLFTGPFAVEVTKLDENAPSTTGDIELTVLALGLSPAVLAFATEMMETLEVEAVLSERGEELRPDPDIRWMGTPNVTGGVWRDSFHFELRGLLRGVREIAHVTGNVRLSLPGAVDEIRLDPLKVGQVTSGGWTVDVGSVGTSVQLELTGAPKDFTGYAVRFDPRDADGEPLVMDYSSADAFGARIQGNFQTKTPAASLGLKIVRTTPVTYAFDLTGVELRRASEQPEAHAALAFEGELPLVIEFVRFTDRSEDFPKVELKVENRSNKVVNEASVQLQYFDASGKMTKEFPQSLTGTFDFDGQKPLTEAHASVTQEIVAFFMPEDTRSIKVRLEELTFADGTRWSPPGQ